MARADVPGELVEALVPQRVVGNQKTARADVRPGALELEHHMVIGVQAVVDEQVHRTQTLELRRSGALLEEPVELERLLGAVELLRRGVQYRRPR